MNNLIKPSKYIKRHTTKREKSTNPLLVLTFNQVFSTCSTISHRVMNLKELTNGLPQAFFCLSTFDFQDTNTCGKPFVRIHVRADCRKF